MPGTHALLSPSGAKKWLACPGSVEMEMHIPEKPSTYANEGTTAHALAELKINHALKRIANVAYGKKKKALNADHDMETYTDEYRDYVMELWESASAADADAEIYVEKKLNLSEWVPEGFGTGDVVIVMKGYLHIVDLKYGQGVKVEAEDNPQLKLYALGALAEQDFLYDITTVLATIYQPRLDHIATAVYTADYLREWGEKTVRPQAEKAYQGITEYSCGKHCDDGFCKARPVCKAYADNKLDIARYEFRHPNLLTEEEISDILDRTDSIVKWATLVKDYALDQAVSCGTKFPGYKIVEGRSNRTWAESEEVIGAEIEKLGFDKDVIMPRKLLTITGIEKLLGKKKFKDEIEKYTVKPQGKPTLVPESDKRPEFNSAAEDFKEDLKEEDK